MRRLFCLLVAAVVSAAEVKAELGANVRGLHLVDVKANLHTDKYPLAHLVCVGPKSCVEKGKDGRLREVFDPWVSCKATGIPLARARFH